MIDEDINERMARLVPQPGGIGEMPSQIPLGISMTPTFERPNAAPDIDTDYADSARRIADSRRTQMMSSLVNITAVDPDSAARSQKLGAQFGVGGDLAARNAEELRQRAFIDSISGRDMLRRNPVLADYIAQRQFAEIAHDDVDALAKTEQEFSKGWFARFDRPVSEVVSEGIAGIGEGFGRAVAQEEMFAIAERVSQRGGRMEEYEKAALESYRQEMARGGERTGFLEEAAYIGAQQLTGAPRIIEAGMMGATAGGALGLVGGPAGFATVPAGMVTGATAGLAAGSFENSRRLESAMLYLDLLPELGHDSSSKIANTVGIFNAALDTGAAALVAKPFAGLLRGAVRQKVSEAIRQQTTRAALANAAKAYGLGVAGEVTTETVQELNNVIGSEIGRYLADKPMEIETEEGREAIATRLVDTFVATAMGMSIMGAPGPAGRLYVDTRAAKQGEQQAAKLQSMVKAIADNKLLARSPERLEEFAETAVEGTDSETTYVNAAVMHDILRQSGITEQEMDTVLPGVRAQLTEMQQNGIDLGNNDITVPTAQMTVRLQKTPLLNQILPHARLSPDAMSITEVQQFEANREQLVAQAREIMEARQETDATFVAEAQAIEDRIFGEITAAGIEGMDERAARANAQFVRDIFVTLAARNKMSPAEAERRFKYRVQGEVTAVAPLEQAAPQPSERVSELLVVSNVLDERGYGPITHPGDDADVAAADAMNTVLGGINVPRKYVSSVESFDYLLGAINAVLLNKSTDSADYDRAAASMGRALRTDLATVDDIVIAAKKLGYAGVDRDLRLEAEESLTKTDILEVLDQIAGEPELLEQAAQPGAARVLGPIEAAKKLVQETGRESFTDADEFFQKRWDALLKQTGRQLEPTSSNFAEAAKRAVSDILDFVKNNPKFADYYANDWRVTRAILDDYVGRPITDDEFALYRTIAGLTSPNTMLPSNISDTVGLWNHWMRFGNFDAFTLGPKPLTGALVVFEAAEPISGTTANIKVRTLKIIERLIKERGGVTQALQYLQEGVPIKELHKFNRKMGYAGNATDIGNITDLVMQATGQDKLIPRMFIFGQKVGAYTLNAIGDERYTTVDIWESRYIRSHFLGMFDKNIGLPESTEEHQIFTRFGDLFKQEMEAVTGRKWAPSALQALRWFYIIGSSREAGYSKASTNETISFYTERQLTQAFGYSPSRAAGGGSGAGAVAAGSGAGKILGGRIEPKPFERNLTKDVEKLADVKLKRRAIAAGYVRFARHNSELGAGGFSFVERRPASLGRHGTLTSATVAAEFTAGSRLQTAFEKAELPVPVMQELVADENGAEAFRSLVVQTNESNPHGAAVAAYTADEYQQKRLFVTADGTAGFALTTDGDIVSVFSAPGSGNGRAVMALAVQVGGTRLDCFDTVLPSYYAAHGFKAVARLSWNDEYAPAGWDAKAFAAYNKGKPDVVFMVYEPGYTGEYKAGAGASVSEYGDGVAAQTSELNAIAKKRVFEQAARGPARGGFDPRRLTTILNKNADLSTFLHETAHFYLHVLGQMASDPAATPEIRADMDTLLSWFGIAGDTAEARLAAWNAMSIDQQRKYHEQFAYSFEVYLFDGKSPSVEMQGLFERFSSWLRRVYKSIRDDLNAIYRREFGEDLPILTGEVRQVMDRMLATEEQIKRQAAINEMKPQFQTQAESGMSDAEWAAYQDMQREAMDAAVTDMTKASLRQMQWLGNARSRLLRDLQRKHDRQRKEVRDEVAEEIRLQPVYRAMEYLRTGTLVNFDGETIKPEGPHRLDMEAVRNIYAGMPTPESLEAIRATGMAVPTNVAPDIAALGTGGNGMMGKDGINPDVAAELFGYSSGDALIRALLAATPMKDAIDARTDEVMLARFSDLVDPKARDAAVQTALHNEARARFVAVELRFVAKATQPTRVLIEAARQAAREMIAGKRIVDVKPQEFIAAEARAARDAADLGKYESQAKITGKAEYDRVRLAALAAGSTEEDAVRVAEEAQAAFVAAKTAEREAEFKARFGASTVQQALIRAKRAQLYQNQLAAEALRVREEVDKGVKYLKQVLRDSNVKRMGADYADQIERILERFNLARLSAKARAERQSLVEWLAKLEQDGLVPDLAPEVIDEANRKPYQEMTVAEFRDLVEAVKQLEYIGKNAQKIKRAEEMAEFNEVRDEIVDSIKSNYTGKVTKPRTPTTAAGRRIAGMKRFLYSHLKAAAIARIFDGGKDDGPVWRYLIRTANAAGDMETRMRAEATKRLTEILAPVFKLGKMGGKGVYFPTIGQSLNREARLVIALNMGNDGNRQRLLDGEGWTLEQLTPVLESLTEAEWNEVQQVWDFLETYRPLIAAKERRLYGKEPNWVTPTPFTVRTADGKEVRLSGGYYPIKYDPVATERAETAEEAEAAKAQLRSAYTAATTRRSFTKARARQVRGRPLLYTMSGVYGGVNDVIHDLSWHEWLIQANRLMRDEKFSSTVRETYGVEAVRQLKDWIKDNAAGEQAAQGAADQAVSILRRNVSAAGLGFNVVSAALQVTGFSQSIVRVGAKHIARGVALTVGSPIATFKAVNEKSSFMAERSRTQFRELNELRNMVQDESASARRLRLGTYFLMMRMQRMVDVPTWVGAYEKALEAGKDEDTAVALADQAVIDSQGGGMLKDLSAAERGGPVSKLFTVFYSYMNTVYNMGAVSTMTPRSKGRLASDYLMLFVVPVVLNYALKNALTPDVDDEEPDLEKIAKDLIAEELAFLMGTMVVVREFQNVANVVTGKETGARGYEGPAGLRGIGETMKFATQASQGEFDRAFRKSAVNMLGLATGLPSAQINRTLDGIEALAEGETENPLAPLTGVKR